MPDPLQFSAKQLGELATPNFCPQCFWTMMHVRNLPFQILPSIFAHIDSFTKRIVHEHYRATGSLPAWLEGDFAGARPFDHPCRLSMIDNASQTLLTGMPDEILRHADGSLVILDYKTAKPKVDDPLRPLYEVQLNAYAVLIENAGLGKVTKLALVYAEPMTDAPEVQQLSRPRGFLMPFRETIMFVELRPEIITDLLGQAKSICDGRMPPQGRAGCQDCERVTELMERVGVSVPVSRCHRRGRPLLRCWPCNPHRVDVFERPPDPR